MRIQKNACSVLAFLTISVSSVDPPVARAALRAATSLSYAALHTAPKPSFMWLHVPEWMCPLARISIVIGIPQIFILRAITDPGRKVTPAGTGISIRTHLTQRRSQEGLVAVRSLIVLQPDEGNVLGMTSAASVIMLPIILSSFGLHAVGASTNSQSSYHAN